jgi:predicted membrane-bound mannosyltransferase
VREDLDIAVAVTIMQAFYAPSLYDDRLFSQSRQASTILRANHHAGAKSTPNTRFIFQEMT